MFSQIKESYPEGAYTALDLVRENFIPSASVIFRRDTDFVFPNWIYYLPYADWPLNLHHAEKGEIWLDHSAMGVQRLHTGGMCTALPLRKKRLNDYLIMKAYSENCCSKMHFEATERTDELRELTLSNDREIQKTNVKPLRRLLNSTQNRIETSH